MKLFFLIILLSFTAILPLESAHALKYSMKLRAEITRAAVNGKPVSKEQKKYINDIIPVAITGKPSAQVAEEHETPATEPVEIKTSGKSAENKPEEKNILEIVGKTEVVKIEDEKELEIPDGRKVSEVTFIDNEEVSERIKEFKKEQKENYLANVAPQNSYDVPMLSFASTEVSPAAKLLLAVTSVKLEVIAKQPIPSIKPIASIAQKPKLEEQVEQVARGIVKREYIVKRGDSFSAIFSRMGYGPNFIRDISKILIVDAGYNPSQIRFGQKFIFTEKIDASGRNLVSLEIPSGLNIIKVLKDANDKITIQQDKKKVTSKYVYKQITVSGSIIASASRAAVPSKVVADATRIMSNKLDLSTQVHAGDKVDILYEQLYDTRGKIINAGRVFYIGIKGRLANFEAFRFAINNNENLVDFYDASGAAFKKSITNNPFARKYRITSGFGYRKHPVLGRRMFHSGMDYGAPPGTPIPAAGDGTIVKLGRYGGYGNYIRIKHDGVWQTAYGHMSRYASGMRVWRKVKAGEIIGYVGSTGRSTGPHLHFETLQNGKYINPGTAALPAGKRLWGKDLTNFKAESSRIKQILSLRKSGN